MHSKQWGFSGFLPNLTDLGMQEGPDPAVGLVLPLINLWVCLDPVILYLKIFHPRTEMQGILKGPWNCSLNCILFCFFSLLAPSHGMWTSDLLVESHLQGGTEHLPHPRHLNAHLSRGLPFPASSSKHCQADETGLCCLWAFHFPSTTLQLEEYCAFVPCGWEKTGLLSLCLKHKDGDICWTNHIDAICGFNLCWLMVSLGSPFWKSTSNGSQSPGSGERDFQELARWFKGLTSPSIREWNTATGSPRLQLSAYH